MGVITPPVMETKLPPNPWPHRLFWLFAIAVFVKPAWIGLISRWQMVDAWVVAPQIRLLNFSCPPLAERWPIIAGITVAHRVIFSLFYGVVGWICVRLVSHQYESWPQRSLWLLIYWAACLGFVQVAALLMIHFGVLK